MGHSSLQFFHPNRELSNGAKPPPRLSFPAPLKHRSRSISTHKEMKVVATLERQGSEGTSAMDLAMLELERHDAVVRAKRKLKTLFIWIGAAQKARERRESAELGVDSPASAAAAADGAISGSAHGIKPPTFSRLESMPEDAIPPPTPLPGDASPLTASMKKDYEAFSSQFCGASTRASVPAPPPAMSPLSPPRSKRPAWSYTMGTDSFKLA
uniref:Uncharacterized protein n=1 Tax=Pseudictyota dubia TaxID=2749911 RepID=A0A7R9WJY0_9STRA